MQSELVSYELHVNGTTEAISEAWLGESLLWVLRERLALPGAKNACDQGECGSCSVKMDGVLVCACLVLAAAAVDAQITTVEAVGGAPSRDGAGAVVVASAPGRGAALSTVQRAFVDAGAVQCGFCTPGLIVTVHDLLERTARPSTLEIREAISGNLCRCTGYGRILQAVENAIAAGARASEATP